MDIFNDSNLTNRKINEEDNSIRIVLDPRGNGDAKTFTEAVELACKWFKDLKENLENAT